MNDQRRVIVAMSGGVDSSVAASLLLRQGYDVTGVFLCLGNAEAAGGGCCSPQDAADARRVAQQLGIPLYVVNVADALEPIIERFVAQYAAGRTPNPCVLCNSAIKFGRLLNYADTLGAQYVATGHYARLARYGESPVIERAAALEKDQSYALFAVERAHLGRILLPVGELPDKSTTRRIARELSLNVHDKPDSQEICFVPDDDYPALLAQRCPQALRPGPIVDSAGRELGRHDGYARFTIGQRRGLRVAAGVPMYVTAIDPATAAVTIGPLSQVQSRRLCADDANWHTDVPAEFRAIVQPRYNNRGAPATIRITSPTAFDVEFDEPATAITPGQAAVVYDGRRLLGGGWIR